METTSQISRRGFLSHAPIAGASVVAAVPAAADEKRPQRKLFTRLDEMTASLKDAGEKALIESGQLEEFRKI